MSIEAALAEYLLAQADVTALVGRRIDPVGDQQSSGYPRITYTVVDDVPVNSMQGCSGLDFSRVQINCYATTFKQAIDVKEAVRLALDGYRGNLTEDVYAQAILRDTEGDLFAPVADAKQQQAFGKRIDFIIHHAVDKPAFHP